MDHILVSLLDCSHGHSPECGLASRARTCHDGPMSRPLISTGARTLATMLPALHLVPGPVYLALADSVTALVRDGRLAPETRLPSERELASELRLSRATVTAAYDQLRERGLLASRTG